MKLFQHPQARHYIIVVRKLDHHHYHDHHHHHDHHDHHAHHAHHDLQARGLPHLSVMELKKNCSRLSCPETPLLHPSPQLSSDRWKLYSGRYQYSMCSSTGRLKIIWQRGKENVKVFLFVGLPHTSYLSLTSVAALV